MTKTTLRREDERLAFCERYFSAVGASCSYSSQKYREYILPLDVDKELTDRPFFWLWAEKTNQTVEPTTLRLAFNEESKAREDSRLAAEHAQLMSQQPSGSRYDLMFRKPAKSELIHLGSFRLDKILDSVNVRGKVASVMAETAVPSDCIPWLMINGTVEYCTDSKQERWFSIGVCLDNLQIVEQFYPRISAVKMIPCPPQMTLKSSRYTLAEAYGHAKSSLTKQLAGEDRSWANDAKERLTDDLAQLDAYYQSLSQGAEMESRASLSKEHARKREDLVARSLPKVEVYPTQLSIIGLGLRQ